MPHPVAIAQGRVLPGIRPTVLGTLSIELVVVVCAVRVEMACGPGARQPLTAARAGERRSQEGGVKLPTSELLRGGSGLP